MIQYSNKLSIPNRYKDCTWEKLSEEIKEIIKKVVKQDDMGLYLHGACGTGKTYIAYATMQRFNELYPERTSALYCSISDMLVEIRTDILTRSRDQYSLSHTSKLDEISNFHGILILDDLGAEKATDFVIETIYKIVNARYENMFKTIITSNLSIIELTEKYGDRIPSRIAEMCNVVNLKGIDRRIKNQL